MTFHQSLISFWALLAFAVAVEARGQTNARGAIPIEFRCFDDPTPPLILRNSDAELTFTCRNSSVEDVAAFVRFRDGKGTDVIAKLFDDDGIWRAAELLWAPDGSAFLINGSENAYSGQDFHVVRLAGARLEIVNITMPARRAMYESLAKCWPEIRSAKEYNAPELDVFNMVAVAWGQDSRSLAVFAEVTPSSSYGVAMGEVMGFEIDVRDGRVLRQMTAQAFKQRWQHASGWSIRIPDAPECGRLYR